ncbi:MAG: cytochrome P450 [Acidobacteriota bacterium]
MQPVSFVPSPAGSRLLLAMRFKKDPFSLLSQLRREHGDVFALDLPGLGRWVFLCSPEVAQEMYRAPEKNLSAADFNRRFLAHLLGKESFVVDEGQTHRARRRPLTPHFNRRGALEMTDLLRTAVERHVDLWPDSGEVALVPRFMELSLENLYRVILGIDDQAKLDELVGLTIRFFDLALKSPLMTLPKLQWNLGRFSPWGKILWTRDRLRAVLLEQVQELRVSADEDTPMGALFNLQKPNGERLSDSAIVDDLLIILNAGQETSSRIIAWTVAGILAKPEVRQRMLEELDAVLGDRPIGQGDIHSLPYMDAVIQEGIRYQPFAPFIGGRIVREPWRVGGHTVPGGSIVVHAHAEVCKREDLFMNPDEFDPDKNFFHRKLDRGQWTPFGGGHHLCLARGLALVQLKVVLATIFQRLDLELTQDRIAAVPSGFLFVPEKGLPVKVVGKRRH